MSDSNSIDRKFDPSSNCAGHMGRLSGAFNLALWLSSLSKSTFISSYLRCLANGYSMLNSLKRLNRTDSLISLIEADLKHGKPDICITSSQVDNDAPSLLSSKSDDIELGKDVYMQPRGH